MDINEEWFNFSMSSSQTFTDNASQLNNSNELVCSKSPQKLEPEKIPKCEELYISTKTKVLFLDKCIDINGIFWKIPIIPYWTPEEGVVKKQIKIVTNSQDEYDAYTQQLKNMPYYHEHVIKQINNPSARRIKFRDERKLTVGISKKDIMNCRGKVKNAFYNCFAIILRFFYKGEFKEIHVKIFNTGKMEIPGILDDSFLEITKHMILQMINPLIDNIKDHVGFINNKLNDSVLINSNFNCGFYINRDKLHSILRSPKYNIEAVFDPCSYPGVKCKFYFRHDVGFDTETQKGSIHSDDYQNKMSELSSNKKYTEVSFMIFRTGSCLIVGNCTEEILYFIFQFIKQMLTDEYHEINTPTEVVATKEKKTKVRKKTIYVTSSYFKENIM
jgi:hypothetical protein